ncbi:MAG TPA: GspE/PulE family protein [Solirubrobacteraceae bacterium]|jgi:type IV pilus assembly protein PilB
MAADPAPLAPVPDALQQRPAPVAHDVPEGATPPRRRGGVRRDLLDVLAELGYAPGDRMEFVRHMARTTGRTPERVLLDEGTITADQLARAVAERFGLDHLDLTRFKVDMVAANAVPPDFAKRHLMVPVAHPDERTLLVATVDPANVVAVDDLAIRTGRRVRLAVASADDISALIGRLNRLDAAVTDAVEEEPQQHEEVTELGEGSVDTPVIKLVNSIIAQAVEQRASDIHLEPDGRELRVRLRVDGVLTESTRVPSRMVNGVVSRIKIMADIDISEKRLPQDGRVGLVIEGRTIDLRVATLPSVHGEAVVLRLLDKQGVVLELPSLGMRAEDRTRLEKGLGRTHGAVLVTGPTGSGKSTTLYAAVQLLNTPDKNVITIEDPVEYQLDGITQVNVNPKAGLTFATGLRATLRSDPDVILVGEIRDKETAKISIEAAMTGHLVLSTLHTNDAASTITRLIEMGVEPFLVASSVDVIVAQRLCRVLCPACKRQVTVTGEVLAEHGFLAAQDMDAYEPVGCTRCSGTGYRGRVGLYEVLKVSEGIRSLALRRATPGEIAMFASAEGMTTLREDGLEKVRLGITSVDEVIRVTGTV